MTPLRSTPLRLITGESAVGTETSTALSLLHQAACSGDVTGVALVVIQPNGRYFIDVLGEAKRSPALARGAALLLCDELGRYMVSSAGAFQTTVL